MNPGLMKIDVWNVRGLYGKEKLLQEELKKANVYTAVIPETKKNLKGSQELDDYILMYSGVPTNKTAAAGIAIMINPNPANVDKMVAPASASKWQMGFNSAFKGLRPNLEREYIVTRL
jgi:hypothetical protein